MSGLEAYTSDNARKVMRVHEALIKYFKSEEDWKNEVEEQFKKSNSKYRAFQTFFNCVPDCLSGSFQIQALEEKNIKTMYPTLLKKAEAIPAGSFLYVFACNDGAGPGKALIADTVI